MKVTKRIGKLAGGLALAAVMAFGAVTAFGEAGDVPAHDKILNVNDDGTYTIALNVTGDSEKQIQKVNVIFIVDRSGSMDTQSGTGAYVPTNQGGTDRFGLVDGEYVALTRQGSPGNRTYWYQSDGEWVQYTGQLYTYDRTATRMQATKAAVVNLAGTLLDYNGKDGNPDDTVEMALVSFGTTATTNVSKTSNKDTYLNSVNGLSVASGNAAGTNWEAALTQADGINFGDTDPTYVIFFSDGSPTFRTTQAGHNDQFTTGVYGSGREEEPNMEWAYTEATDDAAALAQKVGTDHFYTIFAYGSSAGQTYMTNLTTAAGAPSGNNYSASSTAELNDAFAAILESIEMAGIGNVSMEDGTTSAVTTTSGDVSNLLTVDTSSYKYYRAGGDYSDIEDYDPDNGAYGKEWDDAPPATFEGGAVKWDLSDEGVLENDVTYTVTFDCWPSQTTLDIAADIKNDPSSYNSLDANIRQYINPDGSLKTNTNATITYKDTRTDEEGSDGYENPDPVATSAIEQLAVSKEWENELDGQKAEPITLTVTCDGDSKYTMTLGNPGSDGNPDWTDDIWISIGILRHTTDDVTTEDSEGNKFEVLETGHDFTFEEPSDLGYYWELEVPTVRPMLIDGTKTVLIKKEGKYNNPDNTVEYTIDGSTYYVGDTGDISLTATNHRRARLNLTKVVDGEDANPKQSFPFTLNVVDSKAGEGSADNLNSDYYVWFSVWNGGYVDAVVSGAEKEYDAETGEWTGYYYALSGTDIVVNLKAGDNLRFLNLPTDSTYTFTEGTLPANYAFTSSELTTGEDSTFSGAQTTTGKIESTNTDYTVTYTNTYGLTDIEITKEWDDNDDQDGKRPTADEFKAKLTLKAGGTDVTSANADKLTVEVDSEDSNKYKVKWTDLDRYADGEEIEYTVEESEIDGYTTVGSPAKDHGTITNSHTPEVTNVTVTKSWADDSDRDGIRPDELELTLNGAPEGFEVPDPTITGTDGDSWTYTWTGLPKYYDGDAITYTVSEESVPEGYEVSGSPASNNGTITNTHEIETTSVTVTKAWADASNQDGIRPGSLELTLNGAPEGFEVPDPTITKDGDSWTYTWTGLPKNDDGDAITYTVSEESVPEGYEVSGSPASNNGAITNTHTPEVTSITVTKKWKDASNKDGKRPKAGEFKEDYLTLDPTVEGYKLDVDDNGDNTYTITYSNIPKYEYGKEAELVNYKVIETTVPDAYVIEGSNSAEDGGTIVNKHTPVENATIVGLKVLEGRALVEKEFQFLIKGTYEELPAEEPAAEEPAAEQTENTSDSKTEEPSAETEKAEEAQDVADEKAELAAKALEEAEAAVKADASNAEELEKAAEEADAEAEEAQKVADEAQEAAEKAEAEKQEEAVTKETTAPAEKATEAVEEETVSAAADDVNVPLDGETVTHNAQGDITIDIPFEKPGIYTYTITEVAGSDKTITYDSSEKTVVIKVTENEDGSLTPTVVECEGDETYQFTFNNKYTAPDPGTDFIDPPVKKVVKGDAPKTAETYTFKLEAKDDSNPMPAAANGQSSMTMTIKGAGEKEFGKIVFTKEHAGEGGASKVYDYTVTEVAGDNADCEYDGTVYAVRAYVSIVDNKLKVKREYYKNGEEISTAEFQFTNTYEEEGGNGTATGDNNNLLASILLLTLSGLGICGSLLYRRREEN